MTSPFDRIRGGGSTILIDRRPTAAWARLSGPASKGGQGMTHRSSRMAAIVLIVVACCAIGYGLHLNGWSPDPTGTEAMVVVSGSMDGGPRDYDIATIPTGSLVIIRKASSDPGGFYDSLNVGDVLTFRYVHPVSGERMNVTYRIADIEESSGVYTYTMKGDSVADDPTNGSVQIVTSDSGDVIGKVVGVSHWLGVLVVFMSTWAGRFCLIVVPCVVLILSEIRSLLSGTDSVSKGTEDSAPSGPVFVHRGDGGDAE